MVILDLLDMYPAKGLSFQEQQISVSHPKTACRNMAQQKASSNLPGSNMHVLNHICPRRDEGRHQGTASAQNWGQSWPDPCLCSLCQKLYCSEQKLGDAIVKAYG